MSRSLKWRTWCRTLPFQSSALSSRKSTYGRMLCFNSASKWLKPPGRDVSNIFIQIKKMRGWPCAWPSVCVFVHVCVCSFLPDGTVIGIQFDSRSKQLNLLYLDEGHICQENTQQSSICIRDDIWIFFFPHLEVVVYFNTFWNLWTQLKIIRKLKG